LGHRQHHGAVSKTGLKQKKSYGAEYRLHTILNFDLIQVYSFAFEAI
jgi:hypothetical protein